MWFEVFGLSTSKYCAEVVFFVMCLKMREIYVIAPEMDCHFGRKNHFDFLKAQSSWLNTSNRLQEDCKVPKG